MPLTLIEEDVDLYLCPFSEEHGLKNPQMEVTLGDLHGHTLKLLFMLVKEGVIEAMAPSDYEHLVRIYNLPPEQLNTAALTTFCQILENLKFNPKAPYIRLLGDEFADRGSNDYLTLKLFEAMNNAHVPFEILISNHGMEFIRAYETFFVAKEITLPLDYKPEILSEPFVVSLKNLIHSINLGWVSLDEVKHLVETVYKPKLKIVSYTNDEYEPHITLYTHAPVGLASFAHLCELFQIEYNDETPGAFIRSLDRLNGFMMEALRSGTMLLWHDKDDLDVLHFPSGAKLAPFEFFLWNRTYHYLERPKIHPKNALNLHFVHGHDFSISEEAHIICLDNQLGKGTQLHRGFYTVLYTNLVAPILALHEKMPAASEDAESIASPPKPRLATLTRSKSYTDLGAVISSYPFIEVLGHIGLFVEVIKIELATFGQQDPAIEREAEQINVFYDEICTLTYQFQEGRFKLDVFDARFIAIYAKYETVILKHPDLKHFMHVYQEHLTAEKEKRASLPLTLSLSGLFSASSLSDAEPLAPTQDASASSSC